jgi:hypothetical protein
MSIFRSGYDGPRRREAAFFSEGSQGLAASSLLFPNWRKRLRFQALALRRSHKNVCVEITNIPCFQRAHVSNMRLNFNQTFDKAEVCDDAGDRVSAAQRQVRPGSTAVSELR